MTETDPITCPPASSVPLGCGGCHLTRVPCHRHSLPALGHLEEGSDIGYVDEITFKQRLSSPFSEVSRERGHRGRCLVALQQRGAAAKRPSREEVEQPGTFSEGIEP